MSELINQQFERALRLQYGIEAAEHSQRKLGEVDVFVAPRELRQSGQAILQQRIDDVARFIAENGSRIDYEGIEARYAELSQKNVPAEPDTAKYDDFLDILKRIVPSAKEDLDEQAELERAKLEEEQANILSPSEAEELTTLQSINEIINKPIVVEGLFDKIYGKGEEYIDIFPREERNLTPNPNPNTAEYIGRDKRLREKIISFLKVQSLAKTITLEEMYDLVEDPLREKSVERLREINEDGDKQYREDKYIRSRLCYYLSARTAPGIEIREALAESGLVLQRGGRKVKNMRHTTPLLICRVLSTGQVLQSAPGDTQEDSRFIDSWDKLTQSDSFISDEPPEVKDQPASSADIPVKPSELAQKAIQRTLMAPLIRSRLIEIFADKENQVIRTSDLVEEVANTKEITKAQQGLITDAKVIITLLLNPKQTASKPTAAELKAAGMVIERGIITISTPRGGTVKRGVFRMQVANDEPRNYPYEEESPDGPIYWNNILGEYAEPVKTESVSSTQTDKGSTGVNSAAQSAEKDKRIDSDHETEVELDPVLEIQLRTANIVNWLSKNGILNATNGPKSKIAVHPECIPANGQGEVPTKKLFRDMKRIKLIEDDRNITVLDLVVSGLLPSYKNLLAAKGKEQEFIYYIVERTINDFYAQREKLRRGQASRRTR